MRMRKFMIGLLLLVFVAVMLTTTAEARGMKKMHAKNVIFMVPDGMGLADVTAARIFKDGRRQDRI